MGEEGWEEGWEVVNEGGKGSEREVHLERGKEIWNYIMMGEEEVNIET